MSIYLLVYILSYYKKILSQSKEEILIPMCDYNGNIGIHYNK